MSSPCDSVGAMSLTLEAADPRVEDMCKSFEKLKAFVGNLTEDVERLDKQCGELKTDVERLDKQRRAESAVRASIALGRATQPGVRILDFVHPILGEDKISLVAGARLFLGNVAAFGNVESDSDRDPNVDKMNTIVGLYNLNPAETKVPSYPRNASYEFTFIEDKDYAVDLLKEEWPGKCTKIMQHFILDQNVFPLRTILACSFRFY